MMPEEIYECQYLIYGRANYKLTLLCLHVIDTNCKQESQMVNYLESYTDEW